MCNCLCEMMIAGVLIQVAWNYLVRRTGGIVRYRLGGANGKETPHPHDINMKSRHLSQAP